jgi:uncharacterized membrane protein YphA (DoxX/SURF4 family)/uncharacterized protein YqjF (DUF2071 family)
MISALSDVTAAVSRPGVAVTARWLVAATWLVHGFYHKLLGGSPRHLQIVQATPGFDGSAGEFVLAAVGVGEVATAVWVLSGAAPRLCAWVQTFALLSMNLVELAFARHLLLWPAALLPVNLLFLALAWIVAFTPGSTVRTWLRRHPFAVQAHFDECVTLTYAVPARVLRPLVPPGLELETLRGYGFVAVALVQTRSLRPAALPSACGQNFFLAGYRVFTTFARYDGRRLRGLRILRSDADRRRMVVGGNLLTHYNYTHCKAAIEPGHAGTRVTVRTHDGRGDLDLVARGETTTLPAGSPFASIKEARRFAGPLPFTFDYEAETDAIIAIEARRTTWRPTPIEVRVDRLTFFDRPPFRGVTPVLAAAFRVAGIDYTWKRGQRYPLAPEEAA